MEWCDTSLENYITGNEQIPGLIEWTKATIEEKIHYSLEGIMTNVINGLIYIHNRNEVHRDLTPANS
jgi:serine/threonine protein kinase